MMGLSLEEAAVDNCPERMHAADAEAAVDNCPERMHAADAEAPKPPRIETSVELCPGVAVEMEAVDICPERMEYSDLEAVVDAEMALGAVVDAL